jgi:hypothetical protein
VYGEQYAAHLRLMQEGARLVYAQDGPGLLVWIDELDWFAVVVTLPTAARWPSLPAKLILAGSRSGLKSKPASVPASPGEPFRRRGQPTVGRYASSCVHEARGFSHRAERSITDTEA